MSNDANILTLRTLLGDYPNTKALKAGVVHSSSVALDFADVKVPNTAFKDVVRHLKYDVAELAIVTFLQAKAHNKPLVLLPAVVVGALPHPFLVYNAERGRISPADLKGKRVGIRAYSVTTAAWVRGVLQNEYRVDLNSINWVTFEDPHVAEYSDPPTAVRAPAGKSLVQMLIDGEIDAGVVGGPDLKDVALAAGDSKSQRSGASMVRKTWRAADQSYAGCQRVAGANESGGGKRNFPGGSRKQTSDVTYGNCARSDSVRIGKHSPQPGADRRIFDTARIDSDKVSGG